MQCMLVSVAMTFFISGYKVGQILSSVTSDFLKIFSCTCGYHARYLGDSATVREESTPSNSKKLLKVAIIGLPNVGKSTLINQIVGRNVFGVSKKVHTTRCKARAVLVEDDTQIVFLDTPGLITASESRKYHLEYSLLSGGEEAIQDADVFGVVHDASNPKIPFRFKLDGKVLQLLQFHPNKNSFLILNKIDIMHPKKDLLKVVHSLTDGGLKHQRRLEELPAENLKLTLNEVQKTISKMNGWPFFSDVFMVSALNGSGVGDIKEYLLRLAKPGEWMFSETECTDQDPVKFIEHIVFCKLLDNLPNEVPYSVQVMTEYYNVDCDGTVISVVLIACDKPRLEKLVMGGHGRRISVIAKEAEQDLRKFFLNDVRLKLVVTSKEKILKKREEFKYASKGEMPPSIESSVQ